MYKIFINEKPYIISSADITDEAFVNCKRVEHDPKKTLDYIKSCEGMGGKGLVVHCEDEQYAFNDFHSYFVAIEAAGGLVRGPQNQLLLIKRLGKWDLPKGKIDGEETPEEAALREVEEECGIGELELKEAMPVSYHTYKMHNHRFLKITYWYAMHSSWNKPLVPQKEEHITEAKWFDPKSLNLDELDTYLSIRDLLKTYLNPH